MPLTLTQKSSPTLPLDAERLNPATLATLSLEEIGALGLACGNETVPLSQLFDITGDPADMRLELHGDLSSTHYLGKNMSGGEIVAHGSVGRHAGSQMTGGTITIHGDAGDWLGAQMGGGFLQVHGNAGNRVGGAYSGSTRGMNRGTILIEGNCGDEAGLRMRRGMIAIAGNAGELTGRSMLAGTVLALGTSGYHPGLGMKRGSLFLLGNNPGSLPTYFSFACRQVPTVLRLVLQNLNAMGFPCELQHLNGEYLQFSGDCNELGKGEVFVPTSN